MSTTTLSQNTKGHRYAVKATAYSELIVLFVAFSFAASAQGSFADIFNVFQVVGYLNVVNFILLTYVFAYILGRRAEVSIHNNMSNRFLISYKTGFLIVLYSTLVTCVIAFAIALFNGTVPANWFVLYFAKPVVWLVCTSFIPVVIAGSWYGFKMGSKTA